MSDSPIAPVSLSIVGITIVAFMSTPANDIFENGSGKPLSILVKELPVFSYFQSSLLDCIFYRL